MTEEKLISTLKGCVDYLVNKYNITPKIADYVDEKGNIYYEFGHNYSFQSGRLGRACWLSGDTNKHEYELYFHVDDETDNLHYLIRDILIMVDKDRNITTARSCGCNEDYEYVCEKIHEAVIMANETNNKIYQIFFKTAKYFNMKRVDAYAYENDSLELWNAVDNVNIVRRKNGEVICELRYINPYDAKPYGYYVGTIYHSSGIPFIEYMMKLTEENKPK